MVRSDVIQELKVYRNSEPITKRLGNSRFSGVASGTFACDSEFQSFGVVDSLKNPPSFVLLSQPKVEIRFDFIVIADRSGTSFPSK